MALLVVSSSSLRFSWCGSSNSRPRSSLGPPPLPSRHLALALAGAGRRPCLAAFASRGGGGGGGGGGEGEGGRRGGGIERPPAAANGAAQAVLWATEAVYILWLFLLPYAPGDPVWAISPATINDLLSLSLNFFFILPLLQALGIPFIQAPLLHPMAEGLFNFVIAWTLMFAPLLFSDCKRDRFKGSLDLLWAFQMFLTNTFLIPYMAIRLNENNPNQPPPKLSKLGSVMLQGAPLVGLIGAFVCFFSLIWAAFARGEEQFGGIIERTQYLVSYLGSERLAYAFIWDIVLYSIFQPWLIAENIENVKGDYVAVVSWLRFIPVVGLVSYLWSLDVDKNSS